MFKEPLLHFLVLGSLLFLVMSQFDTSSKNNAQIIVVSSQQIEQLHNTVRGLFGREPTPDEMQKTIDEYVIEEVLLREGIKLGVIEEEPSIRRAVSEKVKFLLSDTTMVSDPTDGMLQDFMKKHIDLFKQPARRSFIHFYFDPNAHGKTLDNDIKKVQRELLNKKAVSPLSFGDKFVDGNEYQQIDQAAIARGFGEAFATAIFAAPLNVWQEPMTSRYGVHLVFVSEETHATQPAFDDVREQVKKLYVEDQHNVQNEAAIHQLKQQYQIIIQQPAK